MFLIFSTVLMFDVGLAIVLNDKKQAVRRWAAKVRNLWIALQE
jgi:hypothetical protein